MLARHQYLKEMGIDVWVVRGNSRGNAHEATQGHDTLPAGEAATVDKQISLPGDHQREPAVSGRGAAVDRGAVDSAAANSNEVQSNVPQATSGPVPHFHLCFCRYGRLGICFSLPADAQGMPAGLRRFSDDIAVALGISGAPTIGALNWPMVDSPQFDQSEAAASTALRQRVQKAGDIILLFGATARQYAEAHCKGQVLVLDEIGSYLASSQRKRELWQAIRDLRSVLSK